MTSPGQRKGEDSHRNEDTRGSGVNQGGIAMQGRFRRGRAALMASALLALMASSGSGGAATADRQSLIGEFPVDVQALLTPDIPDEVIAALLKVRKMGPETLVIDDGGGELFKGEQIAYLNNWQKITGWTIKDLAPSPDPGQVKAQVDSGHPQWDMFETGSNGDAMLEEQAGLLAKLDMGLLKPVIDKFPKQGYAHTDYWVQYGLFGVLLTWDLRKWPMSGMHPMTPKDLFDLAKFPGKRCLFKYPEYGGTLEYPLLADGVPADKLYPLNVDRAFKKLDTIKNEIVWWSSGAESIEDIVKGDCAMGVTWHGRPALRSKEDPAFPSAQPGTAYCWRIRAGLHPRVLDTWMPSIHCSPTISHRRTSASSSMPSVMVSRSIPVASTTSAGNGASQAKTKPRRRPFRSPSTTQSTSRT